MKNILSLLALLMFSACQAQTSSSFIPSTMPPPAPATISTFNNRLAHYGWSNWTGKKGSEERLHKLLDEHFDTTPRLDLQAKLDEAGCTAELLWKVEGSLTAVSDLTAQTKSSWIWSGASSVESFSVKFKADGGGIVHLYQNSVIVGQFRCHTSNKRTGDKYTQLAVGRYSVTEKKEKHVATERGLKGAVLKRALSSGVDGKWFHEGSYDPSHGCVRISEPAMAEFFRLVEVGTPFRVDWD